MATSERVPAVTAATQIEVNGINVISEDERKGTPRDLFWPWFAANISILAVSYGSYLLYFGVNLWQAVVFGVAGVIFSFLLCGLVAIAGKRASAPTLIASRAIFGLQGNKLPTAVSWILTVGWEVFLTTIATLATATVFDRLGWGGGTGTKVVALIVVAALVVAAGVAGFDMIMRLQTLITIITAVLTPLYIVLSWKEINWDKVSSLPAGSTQEVVGGLIFMMTAFGLGWVNVAADYSRYLPRNASTRGVIWWTTVGAAVAPVLLLVFGILLAGSSNHLLNAVAADPIGALTVVLPTWFLVPFVVVTVLGLVGGAVLDIYSSGLALLTLGIPIPRWSAALVDGVIMTIGTIYIVFYSSGFLNTFIGFLITLGVPIAAWCGVFLADLLMRRRDYVDADLYRSDGRYGALSVVPVVLMCVATVIGWGLVTNTYADALTWQGFLLDPLGLGGKQGSWAGSNLGVLAALVLGFVGQLLLGRRTVSMQEQLA